jgi:hypothetical protein
VVVSSDAGRFVAWASAYLTESTSLDEAAAAITGDVDVHRVLTWTDAVEPIAMTQALGLLRRHGVTSLRLVLPVPGDVTGVPGPVTASSAATDAGQAVVCVADVTVPPLMFVPRTSQPDPSNEALLTLWEPHPVEFTKAPYGLPTLSEAERQLNEAMAESTATLAQLDVARGRDEFARDLARIMRATEQVHVPSTLSARAQRMIASGSRLLAIVDLAQRTDGASVSATSADMRRAALRPLGQAARYALCAGYSAQAEELELAKLRGPIR